MFLRKFSGALLLVSLLESAAAAPPAVDALQDCAVIAAQVDRLACYDGVAGRVAGTTAGDPAPLPTVAAEPEASLSGPVPSTPVAGTTRGFGAESVPKPAAVDPSPRNLDAIVVGDIDGIVRDMLVSLDNGQRWRVLDDREFDFMASRPAVRITRSPIGTYWMRFGERGPSVKVRRLQ